ncbi:MAG: hypothetical protein ACRELV_03130, partial [Longimicrobiales bacterium]
LYADRDWRVLPLAPLDRIVGYADAIDARNIVLSVYYPPELLSDEGSHYLMLRLPERSGGGTRWSIEVISSSPLLSTAVLRPL